MILVVGASGRLGGLVARQLLLEGKQVRAMSRTPSSLSELTAMGADTVVGDLRDPQSLAVACQGIDAIFSATHAFNGSGSNSPRAVDDIGNRNLIDAARTAHVRHVVFTSILGARPDHPVNMYRYKYAIEQYLRASDLSYTILRPAPFMETWIEILGRSIITQGKAMVFGKGDNPINFVSVRDVARFAVMALGGNSNAHNRIIEVGGPENTTQLQFVRLIEEASGRKSRVQHIPLPMMRIMRLVTQPINPAFSRQILAGIIMDTEDMTFDPAETLKLLPMRLTPLQEVVESEFARTPVTTHREQAR
ncbi:MAG TPA: SDR family oxidoreductase [Ktedonobacterales bacterium]|jgi:NADH dehydrogenase|nr:SDR family oxidoreductase [Ktedonobacterales bacterium]